MFNCVLNMPMKFGKTPLTKYTNSNSPELRVGGLSDFGELPKRGGGFGNTKSLGWG